MSSEMLLLLLAASVLAVGCYGSGHADGYAQGMHGRVMSWGGR